MATNAQQIERVIIDDDVAERLRVVCDELGARHLPLRVVVHALLAEAAERFEAQRENRATASESEQGPRKKGAGELP
jgi:hypothetical protein